MARLLGAFALALFVPAMLAAQEGRGDGSGEGRGRGRALIGQYEITGGEKDGEAIPADRLKDNTVAITEDTFAVVDRDKKELYSAKYTLKRKDGQRGLWDIELESKVPKEGAKAVGLLKREGQEVWLIYALSGDRPEGFEKTEKGQHLFKMKRTAEAAGLNEPAEKKEGGAPGE